MTTLEHPGLPAGIGAALDRLLGARFGTVLTDTVARLDWAEQEIAAARVRHPQHADRLWHGFALLAVNPGLGERMTAELVYRAPCRELLDRLAAGHDTRPGTAAECCCVLLAASQTSPLTTAATGLCMRMWVAAGFPVFPELTDALTHYEALAHTRIDDLEQRTRSKLEVPHRRPGAIDCAGLHHGEPVTCMYATGRQLAIDI